MKQKILDALKAKFQGVSESILSRIAEKLAKTATSDEQVQPAVDGVAFQQIIDSEADRRATEATQTAVANYEKKYSVKEGKPATGGGQEIQTEPDKDTKGSGNPDEVPAWAKALMDKITGLEKDRLSVSRKQKLEAAIEKLPENLRKPYSRIPLTDMSDEDFGMFITETTTEVEEVAADLASKGSILKPPIGGSSTKPNNKEATKEELDAVLSKLPI
ncbi:MAG: hypothetical protein FWF52_04290 [Candidatus Azobacteroides sp.]|nr:hypothetical protein [Candidatus Azobacteroides sp.]